jgi:cysteine desulfurase
LALGGGHEFGIRSGTLAVPLIIGLGKACALAHENSAKDSQKALRLRELLWQGLSENLDHLRRNSPKEHCLPGTLNLAFERIDGEALMMSLSEIAVTAGSACTSANTKPSHVLSALGYGEALAHISLRICIGCDTTQEEINRTIEIITDKVHKLRGISPALEKQTALGS